MSVKLCGCVVCSAPLVTPKLQVYENCAMPLLGVVILCLVHPPLPPVNFPHVLIPHVSVPPVPGPSVSVLHFAAPHVPALHLLPLPVPLRPFLVSLSSR